MIKLCLCLFLLFPLIVCGQNLEGAWYGKVTQIPGGYTNSYNFDLYLKKNKGIKGVSVATIPGALNARVGIKLVSVGDTIRFPELRSEVFENVMPDTWELCIKKLNLVYIKNGSKEFLVGKWTGKSYEDGSDCPPGEVILSRNKNDLSNYIYALSSGSATSHTATVQSAPTKIIAPPLEITPIFKNTSVLKVVEIKARLTSLTLSLRDYEKEDNDTVSIYLNRQILASKVKIGRKPIKIEFELNPQYPLNEILLFAENLGGIPPNTSEVEIHDGKEIHRVFIESDMQKTAAIYIKYTP